LQQQTVTGEIPLLLRPGLGLLEETSFTLLETPSYRISANRFSANISVQIFFISLSAGYEILTQNTAVDVESG
jgi:hypothetical protein